MSTPPRFKRKAPFTQSTIDRTFQISSSKDQLKDIVPCFVSSVKENPKYQTKQTTYQQRRKVQFSCTDELEEKIYQNIRSDDQKSEFIGRNGLRNKMYKDYSARMKIVKGSPWAIPHRVRQMYTEEENKQKGKINFGQGCLAKSAIYYFAVQNRVLFYDVGMAIRLNKKLQDCFLQVFDFQCPIFQLKQLDWSHPPFSQFKNKNLLLISGPWSLEFSVLQVAENSFNQQGNPIRWVKITKLNYNFDIPTMRAFCLTQGAQQLFYIEESGRVNKVSIKTNDFWGRLMNGRKYKLASEAVKNSFSTNYFYVTKKSTFFEKIKHYTKVIFSEIKSLYKSLPSIGGLVYDKKRKLLFSLIDTRSQSSENEILYSYSKLLSCWQVIQGKLRLRCQISEVQLLTGSGNQQIFSHNIAKNNKICKIAQVQECYYPDCCLLVVLNNGVRLYMKIVEEAFQICSYQFPPSFQSRSKHSERRCVQYTKNVELLHFNSSASVNLLTVKQDDTNHTFYIWKDHQLKQYESVAHIPWSQSLYQGDSGQNPTQSFLFRSQLGLFSKKRAFLAQLQEKAVKPAFCCSQNMPYCYSLVRDVYEDVPLYIHATDLYVQHFFALRPIDLLFMVIKAQVFNNKIVQNIMGEFERKDLQVLLIQLLSDDEGLYVMDTALYQCINSYGHKCLELGSYLNFQSYREQFFREIVLNKAKKIPIKQSEPELLGRQEITQTQEKKICELLFDLCSSQKKKGKHEQTRQEYSEEISQICNSILCYLSRVLRFVWMLDLAQIPSKSIHLVQMLQPLLKIMSTVFDEDYISRAKSQLMDYSKTKQKIRRMPSFEPIITYRESEGTSNLQSQFQLIEKLRYFINKIIQLVIMATQTKLQIKKKFHSCIGMEPEYFEQFIFNYIILNYNQPFKMLQAFQKSFPLFIGKNLEKSLRIYNQTKALSPKEVYKVAKEHQNLPDYLLAYLKSDKGVRSAEIRDIKNKKQGVLKISHASGSKQMVEQLVGKVSQEYLSCNQRKTLLYLINKQLQIYKSSKKMGQDGFYLTTRRQMDELQKIVDLQQMLLNEYTCGKTNRDSLVVDQLQNGLMGIQKIEQILQTMNDPKLNIVFLFFFGNQDDHFNKELQEHFKTIFKNSFDNLNESSKQLPLFKISKYIGLQRAKKPNWKPLQKTLMFILGRANKQINAQILVQVLKNSLQATLIASQKSFQHSTQLQCFDALLKHLKEGQAKADLVRWVESSQYPIISLSLVKGGIAYEALIDIYMKQFEQHSQIERKVQFIEVRFILHVWLNLYCLVFEYESYHPRIFDFVDFTKLLLKKLHRNPIQILNPKYISSIKELAKLLIKKSSKGNNVSQEYFQGLEKT